MAVKNHTGVLAHHNFTREARDGSGQMRVDLEIQKRKLRWLRNTFRKVDKKKGFENKSLECSPHREQKSGGPCDIWRRTVEKEATAVGRTWGQIGD